MMYLSSRVKGIQDSITMKLNEQATTLAEEGKPIYNLSGGQLPIKPPAELMEKIHHELNFLKSYQYSSVTGHPALRKKFMKYIATQRKISLELLESEFDCIISNGSKHSIYNSLGALLDPGDEVVLFAPYWVSYPEMIKFWGGQSVIVRSNVYDAFVPAFEDLERVMTPRTKVIILNSPNNPSGVHYSESWMRDFVDFLHRYPDVVVISDEVYSELNYFDPAPTYFYQYDQELLKRTIIIHSISKSFASAGLRVGYAIAPKNAVTAMGRIQGQTTSGASSLIQRSLLDVDLLAAENFLTPVKKHLRKNASILREKFREGNLSHCWYQSLSAFYFLLDFSRAPMFERFSQTEGDHSVKITEEILQIEGIAMVPGSDFGMPNSARMSLTIEEVPFTEAMTKLVKYLNRSK
ncbi:MAG: pyridoxal phosphate-dependent aminotransferase [Bacteriovoracaceae bacterium]